MARIAFLGLGAMGSRMAARLATAGHELAVWNRDPARSVAFVAAQPAERRSRVVAAGSPRAAATGAEFAIAMLRDDDASRRAWLDPEDGALAALAPGSVALEASTLTPAAVAVAAAAATARGVGFLDVPVLGSRPQAEAGQLIVLAGGEPAAIARAEPVLGAFAAAVHVAGPSGAGATLKLAANALFGLQVAAVAELLAFVRASGLDPERALAILGATPLLGPAARAAGSGMLAAAWAPQFPLELLAKDLGYLGAAATRCGATVPMAEAVRALAERAVAAGLGDRNVTGLALLHDRAGAAGDPATC